MRVQTTDGTLEIDADSFDFGESMCNFYKTRAVVLRQEEQTRGTWPFIRTIPAHEETSYLPRQWVRSLATRVIVSIEPSEL